MTLCLDELGILAIIVVGIVLWEVIEHGMLFGE